MNDLYGFDTWCEGRSWPRDEAERAHRAMGENPDAPGKLEFVDGRFYHNDAQRITMLGWLLEMKGADAAVQLGDPDVWRAAIAKLTEQDDSDQKT